jgi:hypothetical protein
MLSARSFGLLILHIRVVAAEYVLGTSSCHTPLPMFRFFHFFFITGPAGGKVNGKVLTTIRSLGNVGVRPLEFQTQLRMQQMLFTVERSRSFSTEFPRFMAVFLQEEDVFHQLSSRLRLLLTFNLTPVFELVQPVLQILVNQKIPILYSIVSSSTRMVDLKRDSDISTILDNNLGEMKSWFL